MKFLRPLAWMSLLLVMPAVGWAEDKGYTPCTIRTYEPWPSAVSERAYELWETVVSDHKNFYSWENSAMLAGGLGVAAIFANTSGDQEIRDWYQDRLRTSETDDFGSVMKGFGEGWYTIPAFVGAAVLGELTPDTQVGIVVGDWGRRCLRTAMVGAPPMLLLQGMIGSSRPDEANSDWDPFDDNNGVSGHGFMGAIPFLSAAKMVENPFLKFSLYLASTFPALSRINDDSHYFSQAALGWWIAYLAATSIDNTELQKRKFAITPAVGKDVIGVVVHAQF